jgi:hypothetical protein
MSKIAEAYQQVLDAQMRVLIAADHLVNEYTRKDGGFGTGVGMASAEDRLIEEVKQWRKVCGGT